MMLINQIWIWMKRMLHGSKSEVAEVGDLAIIKADDLVSSLLFFITTCC